LDTLTINRAQLIDELRKNDIGVSVHFMPVHQHIYYKETFNLDDKKYPVASSIFPRLISLPIYPGMQDEHVEKVIDVLTSLLEKYKR
jgi:perosamine synthetase